MGQDRAGSRIGAWTLLALVVGAQLPFYLFFEGWPRLSDFMIIHAAARRAVDGTLAAAYTTGALIEAGELRNTVWSYPPPFNLFIAPLGLLPLPAAYALVTTLTLGTYLALLGRLAPDARSARLALLAIAPIVLTVLWGGQLAFLTGALVAAFALLHRRGSGWGGVPLGAMVVKPHLVLGIAVLLLLTRDWRTLGVAAATAALLCAAATLAFGPAIWADFLAAAARTAEQFSTGYHPFRRTLSIYGSLRSLDLSHGVALAGHLALMALALGSVAVAVLRGWPAEHRLGLAIAASLTVSPYAYDYDAALLGVALALMASDLAGSSRPLRGALIVLCWLCGASLFAFNMANVALAWVTDDGFVLVPPFTIAGFALALTLWTLWRAAEGDRAPRPIAGRPPAA